MVVSHTKAKRMPTGFFIICIHVLLNPKKSAWRVGRTSDVKPSRCDTGARESEIPRIATSDLGDEGPSE